MATKTATTSKHHSTTTVKTTKATGGSLVELIKENRSTVSAIAAEFIGTFMLVASILSVQNSPLYVAFAMFGIALIVGGVSGSHLNPAMTIGAFITKKISALKGTMYVVAQLLGAGAAWLALSTFIGGVEKSATSQTAAASLFHAAKLTEGKEWYFLFAELLGAIILGLGISTAVKIKKDRVQAAGVAAFALFVALLITVSITSLLLTDPAAVSQFALSFVNPAVALATNAYVDFWSIAIYAFAPIVGGVIGFLVQDLIAPKAIESK